MTSNTMEAAGDVMQNPILVEKIVNGLTYKALKTCRSLNTLWYGEVTKVLKKKSVILVTADTLPEIMNNDPNSTDIFCKTAKINTSFSLGDTPWILNFFTVYAKELEYIEWTNSAEIGKDYETIEWKYDLPNLIELNLKPTFTPGNNLSLILKSAPNLRILRVNFPLAVNVYDRMEEFIAVLQAQTDLRNLKTLKLGKFTFLKEAHVQKLIGLPNLELEKFIMEGLFMFMQSGWVFKAIFERWSDTLVTIFFRTGLPFKLTKIMPRLKKLTADKFRLKRTLPINVQFPSLEYLCVNFDPRFKFDEFIPPNMEPHEPMRELSLATDKLSALEFGKVTRMFEKFPNLTALTIPATDEYLQTIYTSCPNLKSLYIRGTFTDVGVTGIQSSDLDDFYSILMTFGNIVGEDVIQKRRLRRRKSILDLKQLETLRLSSEIVGDKSVLWGILGCSRKLKKLNLPANVTDKSLDALMGMKELRELSIPAPHEGHITHEAMENFCAKMTQVEVWYTISDPNSPYGPYTMSRK